MKYWIAILLGAWWWTNSSPPNSKNWPGSWPEPPPGIDKRWPGNKKVDPLCTDADFCVPFNHLTEIDCTASPHDADVNTTAAVISCSWPFPPDGDTDNNRAWVATDHASVPSITAWDLAGTECASDADETCEVRYEFMWATWASDENDQHSVLIREAGSLDYIVSVWMNTGADGFATLNGALYDPPNEGTPDLTDTITVLEAVPYKVCLRHHPNDSVGAAQKLELYIDTIDGIYCSGGVGMEDTVSSTTPAASPAWGRLHLQNGPALGAATIIDDLAVQGGL